MTSRIACYGAIFSTLAVSACQPSAMAPGRSEVAQGAAVADGGEPAHVPARFTREDNPTTQAGRGDPSLDDMYRPAAWILIDGQEGKFVERDGRPQVAWTIPVPVSASPTFRVEVYEPLLGRPQDFKCTLDAIGPARASSAEYAISAAKGTFEVGRDYALLRPGDNFVVRNRKTGDVVKEIAPLAPGTYMIAAGVKNQTLDREGLAVTYFTVAESPDK